MSSTLYNKLNPQKREVRVIALLPGQWSETIHCVLNVVSPGEGCSYQALSYVWGDPRIRREILINQHPFPVTINLFLALRRLRDADVVRMIWIDALCINQANVDERNQQVSIMGYIYKQAREVLIWLGDDELPLQSPSIIWYGDARDGEKIAVCFPGTRADGQSPSAVASEPSRMFMAFVFLQLMASDTHLYDLPFFEGAEDSNPSFRITHQWEQLMRDLQYLTDLPWWNRIWILQEAVLSARVLVHFGNLIIPWSMVSLAADSLARHYNTCCARHLGRLPSADEYTLTGFKGVVRKLDMLRDGRDKGMRTSLSQLLIVTSDRKATDERDKVYALLSLVTNWYEMEPIHPDYGASTAVIYAKAVILEIQGSRSLQILQGIPMDAKLPSWVTKASSDVMPISQKARISVSHLFDAAKGTLSDVKVFQGSMIGVLGHSYGDTVTCVSPYYWGETRQTCGVDYLEAALKAWQVLADIKSAPDRLYPSGGTWEGNFWRAIVNDALDDDVFGLDTSDATEKSYRSSWRRLRPTDRRVCEAWWLRTQAAAAFDGPDGTLLPGRETWAHVPESERIVYDQAMQITTLQRRFFITGEGFMGTGPLATQPGDRITILFGGDVPFLLRKDPDGDMLDNTAGGSSACWKLIGDCYIHGIMDGEIMDTQESQTRYLLR